MYIVCCTYQINRQWSTDIFAKLDRYGRNSAEDVLEEWFASPCLGDVDNPIQHWNSILTSSKNPEKRALARMSLDYLSVLTSSTDVEWAFSHGSLTVSKRWHALNDESTRAAIVLSSWAKVTGLVPEEEIIEVFRGKTKRTGKEKDSAVIDVDCDVPTESEN